MLFALLAALNGISDSRADGCLTSAILRNGAGPESPAPGRHYDNPALAKLVRSYAPQIVQGYHLPQTYTSGYYSRRIEPYLAKPNYAPGPDPEKLYRGMYLTPDEVSHILDRGHEASKVTWTAGGPGISFSSSIEEAKTYIFHSADGRTGGIGVIFEIRKTHDMLPLNDSSLNSTRTIFKTQADVPPGQISNVLIWGQWGAESIESVIAKIRAGTAIPHAKWTNAFENVR